MNRKVAGRLIRFILLIQILQFVSLAFISTGIQLETNFLKESSGVLHTHDSSLYLSVLLKEKDESEDTETGLDFELPLLLDLSRHSYLLTLVHESRLLFMNTCWFNLDSSNHPLFKINCVFII